MQDRSSFFLLFCSAPHCSQKANSTLVAFCRIFCYTIINISPRGIIVYAGNTIINLIYYFAAGSIVSFEVLTEASSNVITNAVVSIVMIIINVTYFGKRKHLFVNP